LLVFYNNCFILIPFHAFLELADLLIFVWFPEDVKVFVGDQEEIVFIASPSLPRTFHLPLHFYDVLAQDEAGIQEGLQDPRRDRDEVLVPAGVVMKTLFDFSSQHANHFQHRGCIRCLVFQPISKRVRQVWERPRV
jgi:hypothetical protein